MMAKRSARPLARGAGVAASPIIDSAEASLLDVLDNLLGKGVILTGDAMIGVAGVDLIYLRLSTLLCVADRVLVPTTGQGTRHTRAGAAQTFVGKLPGAARRRRPR
jgi:Gas vesicle protein